VDNERAPLLLLLAAIPIFFLGLGANSIWDANEAFYVETPRQMVLTGDYLNPSFGGEPRFNKPVLSYWLVAGAYRVLGESVAVERVVIALAAIGILFATAVIGRAIGSGRTGLLSALLLATAPRFVFFSRRILIDVLVTMFMTCALACFVSAERHSEHPARRRRLLGLMYLAIGLGVLTKGPVAFVLPALALGAWLASERRLADLRHMMIVPGTLIVLAVVVPWYAAIYSVHGWDYIRQFFIDENLGRFASPVTTARNSLFFLPVLFADILMPWAPLLAVPMLTAWRREPDETTSDSSRRLLWWWVVVTVIAFSLSASKEDLYILPAIPAAAVLVADALIRTAWGEAHRGISYVLVGLAVLCLVLAGAIGEWFVDGYYAVAGAASMAMLLALTGVLSIASLWRRQFFAGVLTLASGFILFNYLFVARALPDIERLKPVPPLAKVINERGSRDAALAFYNMDLPSFVYYTRRPAAKIGDADAAARFLLEHPEAWLVSSGVEWEMLKPRVPDACVAARHPLLLVKASDVLFRRPPPDVLLLTRGRNCGK
jgi:4-amino-4-deoxy-L-arabinose transferase-like glycosyltransferase